MFISHQQKYLVLLNFCLISLTVALGTTEITSIINSDKIYEAQRHNNQKVFSIDLQRLQTTEQPYSSRCKARQRKVFVSRQEQIYRLGSIEDNRTQSVFDSLTKLQDQQKFIMQFNKIGNYIFLIKTDNEGLFLNIENPNEKIKVSLYADKQQLKIKQRNIILNFNNRALLINNNSIIICSQKDKMCEKVQGYQSHKDLRSAAIFQQDTQYFLFILTGQQIVIYEISANAKVSKQNSYSSHFFGKDQAFFQTVVQGPNHTLLFLDGLKGIWQCTYTNDMSQLSNPKSVFDQPSCYKMVSENQSQYLVLTCSMNRKSFFVMELIKSPVLGIYEPQSPIFRNENIYDIDINGQTIMSRVYSGIRFFWASKSLQNPYPYDFLHAGDIFLHNALQAKIIQVQNKQYVYLSSEDQMRRYELMVKQPYILCFSGTSIIETYRVKYTYLCPAEHQEKKDELSQICHDEQILKYQAWEHKQVRINTMLFPFMMLLIGVSCMFISLWKFYTKFKNDIKEAKQKFDTDQIKAQDFEIDQ